MAHQFHEAKQAVASLRHEYTATNSLGATSVFGVVHACDLALRALYTAAVGSDFPHDKFKPTHQPESLTKQLGVNSYYTANAQQWLSRLTGHALADARYPNTRAYASYTNQGSADLASDLIRGASEFVAETESLASRPDVIALVRSKAR